MSTLFWFSQVFRPHQLIGCRTCALLALWGKESGDVAWAPQLYAWRNKPHAPKEQIQTLPMLRFVLPTSKSMVFHHPWQFSISRTIAVSISNSQSFHLYNKWGCGFKRSCTDLALLPLQSLAELQLTPVGVEFRQWEIILKTEWKKISNHICFPFFPSHPHPSLGLTSFGGMMH